MKKYFTYEMLCMIIVYLGFILIASGQPCQKKIKFLTQAEHKNIFEQRMDIKLFKNAEKFSLPLRNENDWRGASVNSLVQIIDSAYFWSWDTIAAAWKPDAHGKNITYAYNANNSVIGYEKQEWNGNAWVNNMKWAMTYDLSNNLTDILIQQWNGTAWENYYEDIMMYDINNNELSDLFKIWNGASWDNYDLWSWIYDANNNQITELYQEWNSGSWENVMQYLNTYDANNNKVFDLRQDWNGSWTDNSRDSLTYNVNNYCIYALGWNWDGLSWSISDQEFFTYDANHNLINWLYQGWDGTSWSNVWQRIKTYDNNNNRLTNSFQNWTGSMWANIYLYSNTYDANNFETSGAQRYFDNTGSYINEGDSGYYYFHSVPSYISDYVATDKEKLILFPNPVGNELQIKCSTMKDILYITIYDMESREIMRKAFTENEISQQLVINVQALNAGTYVAMVHCKEKSYRVKFMKGME
jgi:hypothetical protein